MARLFLAAVAIPLAAAVYFIAGWLAPRVLEPVPEHTPEAQTPKPLSERRRKLSSRQLTSVRAGAAVAVLALVAFGVTRWPQARPGGGASSQSVAPAPAVQLPPPIALKIQTRFGADGSGNGEFHDPRDVAVDSAGNVYIADTGNKRVLRFKPDGTPSGALASGLGEPSALTAVKDGIIVDDSEAGKLYKFDLQGQPVQGFDQGLGLSHPRGIAAGPDGTIYVADTANDRIVKVGPNGATLGAFDTKGAKLEQPTGVVVDEQGSVYSIEPAASRIQKFSADGSLQAHLFLPNTITVYPPRGMWIPGRGLTVALPDQNELLTYGPAGTPQATFAAESPAPIRPTGLALAPDGQAVWVVWNTTPSATLLLWP